MSVPGRICMCSFSATDAEQVYDPQEDSYLLCDAISSDIASFASTTLTPTPLILEIGSGSGIATAHTLIALESLGCSPSAVCVDINPAACQATARTLITNGLNEFEVINADVTTLSLEKFHGKVDILIFNPPYVPTPSEEITWGGIAASWAGGVDGREVIDKVLPIFPALLSKPHGRAYIVLVQENKPKEVAAILSATGLAMTKVVSKRARNELLFIYRVEWPLCAH